MAELPNRRPLRFDHLDDVVREAESLLAAGYTRAGQWSLGQMCDHLAQTVERCQDGFPMMMPAPIRWLITWIAWKKVLRHEQINRAVPAPKWLQPPDQIEDRAGVERLKAAIARYHKHTGPLHPSPVFGKMSADDWRAVHLWHSEHHLSFLHPRVVNA